MSKLNSALIQKKKLNSAKFEKLEQLFEKVLEESFTISLTSFFNSSSPCLELLESLLTAISYP